MTARLPPLNALPAFEAAARHLNLSAAGAELHVTKGAVSLQLKRLEESVGAALFVRGPRGLALTPAGEAYLSAVQGALRLVEAATARLQERARPSLTVSCTPGFAVQWLVPRLARFEAVAPGVTVRVLASNAVSDFARDRIDFAVRHGVGGYPGLCVEKLFDDDLVVVAAPSLVGPGLSSRRALRRHVLLHDEHRGDWRLWLEAAGLPEDLAERGPVFADSNLTVEAARAGRGLALVPLALAATDLAAGRLVRCLSRAVRSGLAYHLVYPEPALLRPGAAQFRGWLLDERPAGT